MSSCTLEMDLELSTISVPLAAERRGKTRLNILFFFFFLLRGSILIVLSHCWFALLQSLYSFSGLFQFQTIASVILAYQIANSV